MSSSLNIDLVDQLERDLKKNLGLEKFQELPIVNAKHNEIDLRHERVPAFVGYVQRMAHDFFGENYEDLPYEKRNHILIEGEVALSKIADGTIPTEIVEKVLTSDVSLADTYRLGQDE